MGWGGYYEYFYISNNARLDGGSVDRSRVKGAGSAAGKPRSRFREVGRQAKGPFIFTYCPPLRRRLVLPGHLWKKSSTILVA